LRFLLMRGTEQMLSVRNRPSFSRNATSRGQALNVGFRQELTLNLRHRNDGFVPIFAIPAALHVARGR